MSDNSTYTNAQLRCPGNPGQTYVGIDAPSANCSACFLKRRAHVGPDNLSPDASVAAVVHKGFPAPPKNVGSAPSSSRLKCPDKDTVYDTHSAAPCSCALFSILLWRGVITDAAGAGTRGWMRPQPTAQTVSKSAALMSSTLPFKLPMQLLRFHPSNVQMPLLPFPLSSPLPLLLIL
jgi:hypothetical protein